MPRNKPLFKLKTLHTIIIVIISSTILAILFSKFKGSDVFEELRKFNIIILIPCTVLFFVITPSISALRYKTVLGVLNLKINFKEAAQIYFASLPLAKISPGNVGDMIRAYYLKSKISPTLNSGGILMERMTDFFILAIFAFIGGFVYNNILAIIIGAFILFLLVTIFIIGKNLNSNKYKWQKKLHDFTFIYRTILEKPKSFALILSFAILLWLNIISYIYLLFVASGNNLPLGFVLATQPLVIFFGLLPITLSGIGTRESAMLYLYSNFLPNTAILAVGLTYSLFGAVILPALGIPLMYKLIKLNSGSYTEQ